MPRASRRDTEGEDAVFAQVEPRDRHDPRDALVDSEIDFDDETDDDQLPLDEVEAREIGVNLDDPEQLDDEE